MRWIYLAPLRQRLLQRGDTGRIDGDPQIEVARRATIVHVARLSADDEKPNTAVREVVKKLQVILVQHDTFTCASRRAIVLALDEGDELIGGASARRAGGWAR